jgi:two-component system, cell cycle response regulator DivK
MKHRILVVEDNPANIELLVDWLEAHGYEAQTAMTLEEAFAVFGGDLPEMVLLDVELGAQDGLALANWMREDPRLGAIPVIAVTAHAMATDKDRVLRAGCRECVPKPIEFPLLRRQLDYWLGEVGAGSQRAQ